MKVYVRDLLEIIVGQSMGKKLEFTDLVTQLTTKKRNLALLGVTQENCDPLLYPVIESCLPVDVFAKWQDTNPMKTSKTYWIFWNKKSTTEERENKRSLSRALSTRRTKKTLQEGRQKGEKWNSEVVRKARSFFPSCYSECSFHLRWIEGALCLLRSWLSLPQRLS